MYIYIGDRIPSVISYAQPVLQLRQLKAEEADCKPPGLINLKFLSPNFPGLTRCF